MFDAAIKSNQVLTPSGCRRAVVIIKNGKILDLLPEMPTGDFDLLDLGDLILMPAVIDPHVHINEPGRTEWEGFDSATRAALAGGIGTMVDMPLNSSPVTTSREAFELKLSAAKNSVHCNCGFWGGVIPGNEREIESLVQQGVLGFKAFLAHSGIDEFPAVTEPVLRKVMPVIAANGLPLLVHCELESSPPDITNERSYLQYMNSRPAEWEHNAVALMIRLCAEFNCRTHIVHVSSAATIDLLRKAKRSGLPITAETAQHYLYFEAEKIPDGRTEFKCAPPIRNKDNRQKLWEALVEGVLDFVATDHSPSPPSLKHTADGSFLKAWGGIASLQFALPALWSIARKNGVSIDVVAKWLCSMPAEFCGLSKSKGSIAKGFDADLIAFSPDESFTVSEEMIHHRHKLTPYFGEQLYGVVKQVWLHGKKLYADGKFIHLNQGRIILKA